MEGAAEDGANDGNVQKIDHRTRGARRPITVEPASGSPVKKSKDGRHTTAQPECRRIVAGVCSAGAVCRCLPRHRHPARVTRVIGKHSQARTAFSRRWMIQRPGGLSCTPRPRSVLGGRVRAAFERGALDAAAGAAWSSCPARCWCVKSSFRNTAGLIPERLGTPDQHPGRRPKQAFDGAPAVRYSKGRPMDSPLCRQRSVRQSRRTA